MIRLTSIFGILILICSTGWQTTMSEQLLGSWKFVSEKKIVLSADTLRTDSLSKNLTPDNFFQKGIEMSFRDSVDLAFEVSHEGLSLVVPYTLKDSVFTIINRQYQILSIDEKTLLFSVKTDSIKSKYTYERQ